MVATAPVISICHGGGPMPILNHPSQQEIIKSLKNRVPSILKLDSPQRPKAVLLVTAHWEETITTLSNGTKHEMYYDYGGFPREAYTIKHDAPGDPATAQLVAETLAKAGIQAKTDKSRGWDHGVFVPMKLIDPPGELPIVQMSVLSSQSAHDLFVLGTALQPLREQGIAIIGSGSSSFHNAREWFSGGTQSSDFQRRHAAWARGLDRSIAEEPSKRLKALANWRQLDYANNMHPPGAAEHFSPLVVCAGAAGDWQLGSWTDEQMGVNMKSYFWTSG